MAAPLRCALRNTQLLRLVTRPVLVTEQRVAALPSLYSPTKWNMYQNPQVETVRYKTFIKSLTAADLWKSVSGVSNAGRKRGRGKRGKAKRMVDLNKGRALGSGQMNMMWPGLNAPIIKGREVVQRKQLPPNPDKEKELIKRRDESGKVKSRIKLSPLERGWTGGKMGGQSCGPPDPVGDYKFENFDSRVIELRLVSNMTGTLGRKQRFSAFVVTGNKNGLAGYGSGKSTNARAAVRIAKNRAAQKLQYIPRFDGHTVFHNMYLEKHCTKIFVHKKEEGYGLKCHRALRTIAELMGIRNMYAKVEGNVKNYRALTMAFVEGMAEQETHQDLADRIGYHVIEMRKDRDNLPVIVASPSSSIVETEELRNEEEDIEMAFERLYYEGRMEAPRVKPPPFYESFSSFKRKKTREAFYKGQPEAKLLRDAGLW